MISLSLKQISLLLNASLIGKDQIISSVTTDSRNYSPNSLFIALKGNKFDANNFINDAIRSGACAIVVNSPLKLPISQLIVKNTSDFLGKLGALVRQKTSAKVIALTGSSGKTTVKEMTSTILSQHGQVVATEKNFNNNIGVPITLLRLTKNDDFAVIEIGASRKNEILWSTNLVVPDIALINNIYIAHLAGFGTLQELAEEKGQLFAGLTENGIGIFNNDSNNWDYWKTLLKNKVIHRFSIYGDKNVNFFASNIMYDYSGTTFILHTPYGSSSLKIKLLGKHNVSNAIAASVLSFSVGSTLQKVITGLTKCKNLPGRLNPIIINKNQLIIDDSYNANIGSMNAAIKVLENMPGYKIMVVGDITELGKDELLYHSIIGTYISQTKINKVLGIGTMSYFICKTSNCGEFFNNESLLISRILKLMYKYKNITILVKGSRSSKMENIVNILQEITK